MDSRKLTYKFVKDQFENEGHKLLSKEYTGAHHKLNYICPNGHKHAITWTNWQQGKRCIYCSKKAPVSIDIIRDSFVKENYDLLSKKYVNNYSKLEYRCPKGHIHKISWSNWQKGARCPYCANRPPINIEFIRSEFEREDYKLLTNQYINCSQKLEYICPVGHKHKISWDQWRAGTRCYYCHGKIRKKLEDVRIEFENESYILLTDYYINNKQLLRYKCAAGHSHLITWRDWSSGRRCPTCYRNNNIGSNHPNWRGGISCEPYCDVWLDKEFKESIKERDNYTCQNPDCWKTNFVLTIHHIDYDKKNCKPDNLIILCKSCNSRANYNRNFHRTKYKNLINMKYYTE